MRDSLIFYVNGKRQKVSDQSTFRSLSDYLRLDLGLTGTKVVCAEGDCGSCTVLLGRYQNEKWNYNAVDCCIQYLFQVDGAHVITVEALREGGVLHPVQQVMVDQFGSQCGYCTPGFVMALTALVEQQTLLTRENVQLGLTGNLCRCTGYKQIYDAALSLEQDKLPIVSERYRNKQMEKELEETLLTPALIQSRSLLQPSELKSVFLPVTLSEAVSYLADNSESKIISGGTDVSVQLNKGKSELKKVLCLTHLKELEFIQQNQEKLTIGSGLSWTELERFLESIIPQFHEIIKVFGSPQIRNAGTMGGNIANASPIADSLPFLLISDAQLELTSSRGVRHLKMEHFYQGYKKMDLMPDELISRISLRIPQMNEILRLYKVSKRRDLDISTFTAGLRFSLKQNKFEAIRLAMGGVAPVAMRLMETENWLFGREFTLETMKQAGRMAVQEISPISDVRASREYRMSLAENVFEKIYYESNSQLATQSA